MRFAQARGGRIAYQDFGSGPTVVAVPPMAQNIELAWEWPEIRQMLNRFGSFCRWVQFDKRGTGASDRSQVPGLDERVDDLRAVMDDAEIDRAFLYGASEGGPMCILFAATYPDRVDGLIQHGTTASYRPEELTEEQQEESRARRMSLAEQWGTPASPVAKIFSPSMAHDPDYCAWFQRYERLSADRDSLIDLLELMGDFDVTDLLADISLPTLVMHRKGDLVIPVKYGHELAEQIPGAELVVHPGSDHFAFAGDQDWLLDLERFVTGTVQHQPLPKVRSVRITTLGRFVVEVDGVAVPTAEWRSRIPREICKRLVAARGWPITRDALFDAIWPDEHDRAKLSARLSVHLSSVRRVLGGGVIADRQTVALNLDEVHTDLEGFFAATNDEEVVALYDGPFLPEDTFEEWTHAVRDEALLLFKRAATRMAKDARDQGDFDGAIALARRIIEADKYDDAAHKLLVEVLLRTHEEGLAIRAHAAWAAALADLDAEPPPLEVLSAGS